jgi:hypothetical protein
MPRRAATITQADVARTIRAAKQAGAEYVEVRPDGTIFVGLKDAPISTPPISSDDNPQPVQQEIVL